MLQLLPSHQQGRNTKRLSCEMLQRLEFIIPSQEVGTTISLASDVIAAKYH